MEWLKKYNIVFVNIFMILLIVIFITQTITLQSSLKDTHSLKIIIPAKKELKINLKIENEIIKSEIKRVEQINDKRFEMLGWELAILFSIIAVFMAFQFVNSKATIRDLAIEELNKIMPDIETLVEERAKFIQSELNTMKKETQK